MKYLTVYAGVNGAGKTTMYRMNKTKSEEGRINSDEILREFGGDWKKDSDQFRAGKIALQRKEEYLQKGISYSQETTLATRYIIKDAIKARELGYITEMHYVSVESADIAIERVKNRVKDGGHGIPDDLVRRRYEKSLNNLKLAIESFNTVYIYDNTELFKHCATYLNGELIHSILDLPKWFKDVLNKLDINPQGII